MIIYKQIICATVAITLCKTNTYNYKTTKMPSQSYYLLFPIWTTDSKELLPKIKLCMHCIFEYFSWTQRNAKSGICRFIRDHSNIQQLMFLFEWIVDANLVWYPSLIQSQDVVQNVSVTLIVNMVLYARTKNVLKNQILVIHHLVDRVPTVWLIAMVTQFAGNH